MQISQYSKLIMLLDKLSNLVFLNILTVLCSLPIITIGASSTALYYTIQKDKLDGRHIFRVFFRSFKENFKQATVLWIGLLVVGCALLFSILFSDYVGLIFLKIIAIVVLVVWCAIVSWLFPLLSKFYFRTSAAIRNSLLCAVAYWPLSLLMVLTNFLPFGLLILAPDIFVKIGYLWIIIWFALAALCNLQLLKIVFTSLENTIDREDNPHNCSKTQ